MLQCRGSIDLTARRLRNGFTSPAPEAFKVFAQQLQSRAVHLDDQRGLWLKFVCGASTAHHNIEYTEGYYLRI